MLKKILIAIALTISLLLLVGYLNRDSLFEQAAATLLKPDAKFAVDLAPTPPDYTLANAWAALPETPDAADERPLETIPPAVNAPAVFFIHPTTLIGKRGWNQSLDDSKANWITDQRVLRHQASVFNSCCEIYAPRYRQATIYSFIDSSGSGDAALDLAYQDVISAFDQFLQQLDPQQPFIIAGHSQGSLHASRLVAEKIADGPDRNRLIAAYLIGFSINEADLGGLPVCEQPDQTGCAVGWNTVDGNDVGLFPAENPVCVNPLSWSRDGAHVGHSLNTGSIGYPGWGPEESEVDVTAMNVEVGVADAQCRNHKLIVSDLRSDAFPSRMPGSSLHIYDYSLFHMNIRENANARVAAFQSRFKAAEAGGQQTESL
jgi:hypothetical protein